MYLNTVFITISLVDGVLVVNIHYSPRIKVNSSYEHNFWLAWMIDVGIDVAAKIANELHCMNECSNVACHQCFKWLDNCYMWTRINTFTSFLIRLHICANLSPISFEKSSSNNRFLIFFSKLFFIKNKCVCSISALDNDLLSRWSVACSAQWFSAESSRLNSNLSKVITIFWCSFFEMIVRFV